MKTGIIIAMEICDGDLARLLLQKECLPEKDVIDFLHQIGMLKKLPVMPYITLYISVVLAF